MLVSLTDRAKLLGPILRLVLCICILPVLLILWLVIGIVASIVGGAAYGFFSPIFATFDAVGEGKKNVFFHCIYVCFVIQVLMMLAMSNAFTFILVHLVSLSFTVHLGESK